MISTIFRKCNGYSSIILDDSLLKIGAFRLFILLLLLQIMADSELLQVVTGNSKFANKFYNILAEEEKGKNVFFSPISAHIVLSMAYQGAAGTTADAFSSSLHLGNENIAATGYHHVMSSLNSIKDVKLHIANKIYVMQGFPLKEKFLKSASELFLSETESLNFAESENSARKINGWVEGKTNSKIKDLIDAGCLDALTRLVLVNAIYFKGNWAQQFKKEHTMKEKFYISEVESVDCHMMHLTRRFRYRADDHLQAQILEMKYTNENISMVIILPFKRTGIEELEKKLVDVDFATLSEGMRSMEVEVSLPKFKVETTMDLQSILTRMGLGVIFDQMKANFSEISNSDEQLYVSKAIQKAFIEVNEEGAEAAAATGAHVRRRRCLEETEQQSFVADHPFIFLITTKPTELSDPITLFFGRVLTDVNFLIDLHDEL
uniref:Serpin domain-containing protein n=1 Tax=Photinus pyralis TaxID=7054 RepID=A0A1Y1KYH2_PHOPY